MSNPNQSTNRKASAGAILLTSICIQALLVGGFWYFEPLRKSTMSADKEQVEEQLEEVKKRGAERLERERKEREQRQLRKEDAEKLKKEEEHKRKRKMIEKIAEMHDLEKELEQLKQQALEQLQERETDAIVNEITQDLERQAEELEKRAQEADRRFDNNTSEEAKQLAKEIREEAKQLRDKPEQGTDELRKTVDKLQERADKLDEQARRHHQREAAENLQKAAQRLEETARQLDNLNGEMESQEQLTEQAAQLADQLAEQGQQLQQDTANADQQIDSETSEAARQNAEQIAEQGQALRDAPLNDTDAIQDRLEEVGQQAGEMREQAANQQQRASAEQVAETARAMSETAKQLADTQADLGTSLPSAAEMENMNVEDLHNLAQDVEQAVAGNFADIRAAELAMNQNTSYQEARSKISDLGSAASDIPDNLSQTQVGDVGELNQYREALDQAQQSTNAMWRQSQNMANQARGMAPQAGAQQQGQQGQQSGAQLQAAMSALQRAANGQMGRSVDLSGVMRSQMNGGQGTADTTQSHRAHDSQSSLTSQGIRQLQLQQINDNQIKAEALPGRMFTKNSPRTGWLFLDTWYVIGPWSASFPNGKVDYSSIHPPEVTIDLDATYRDGKPYRGGPKQGEPRELKWRFMQSSTLRTTPPDEQADSVYYCYTEVFFEEDTDMLIAVGTDDAAKVWINDMVVWQDDGLSAWSLKEGFRKVFFKQGFNTVLVRITNGPVVCQWSVLLCPAVD